MTTPPAITIPRLTDERESPRAYAARVEYLTMGPQRSLDAVSQKSAKSLQLMKRWSVRFDWVDHARRYDDAVLQLAITQAADAYRASLDEHRRRYQDSGKALHGVAITMLATLRAKVGTLEMTPAALTTIARALTVAADLEAHALRIGDLIPRLSDDLPDHE